MGTVVFPDAPLKVFLTASAEERARRHHGDADIVAHGVVVGDTLRDRRIRCGKGAYRRHDFLDFFTFQTTASGVDRARIAAEQAVASPLLDGIDLSGARGVLVNVTASRGLKGKEIKEVKIGRAHV